MKKLVLAAFAAMVAASVVFPSFGEDGKDTADGGNVLVEKRAKPLEWLFPMGDATPHEGMAFADGATLKRGTLDVKTGVGVTEFRHRADEFVNAIELPSAAVSPDGCNELRLELGQKDMAYSVWRNGKALVEPTRFSLSVEGRGALNGAGVKPEITSRKIGGTLATPLYKKSSVDLTANETRVDFGDWAVVLHARNDGVAWRFETKFAGEITVNAESTNIRFPKGTELCYTVESGFMSGWEKPAKIGPVESVPAGHPQIVMTPFTATVPNPTFHVRMKNPRISWGFA